jgi:4'-phosphopantetheinyl transferase
MDQSRSLLTCSPHVDIWVAAVVPFTDAILNKCQLGLLDDEELARWQRFTVPKARDQFLAAHTLLRTVLSRYAAVDPRNWRFATNSYGCPRIAEPAAHRSIRFNMSHTDGLVTVAVALNRDVGIDVENITRTIKPLKLANHFFSAQEIASLTAWPEPDRTNAFFDFWTLKEAYIKARGQGLSLPLDSFAFTLGEHGPSISFDKSHPDPGCWDFALFSPTTEHRLAIAVASTGKERPNIRIHWA